MQAAKVASKSIPGAQARTATPARLMTRGAMATRASCHHGPERTTAQEQANEMNETLAGVACDTAAMLEGRQQNRRSPKPPQSPAQLASPCPLAVLT